MKASEFVKEVSEYIDETSKHVHFKMSYEDVMYHPYSYKYGFGDVETDEEDCQIVMTVGDDFDEDTDFPSLSVGEILEKIEENIEQYGDKELAFELIDGTKEVVDRFVTSYNKIVPWNDRTE